jgi:molybdopterin-binding protein
MLTALLTRQAVSELALQVGGLAVALVKAPSVHVIVRR